MDLDDSSNNNTSVPASEPSIISLSEEAETFTSNKLKRVRNILPGVIHDRMIKSWLSSPEDRQKFREWSGSAMSKPIVTHIAEQVFGVSPGELVKRGVIPKDTISHLITAIRHKLGGSNDNSSSSSGGGNNNNIVGEKRGAQEVELKQKDEEVIGQPSNKRGRQLLDEWESALNFDNIGGQLSDYGTAESLLGNMEAMDTTDPESPSDVMPPSVNLTLPIGDVVLNSDQGEFGSYGAEIGEFSAVGGGGGGGTTGIDLNAIPVSDTSIPAEEVPGFEDRVDENGGYRSLSQGSESVSQEQLSFDFPSVDQIPNGVEQIDPRALQDTLTEIQKQVVNSKMNTTNLLINVTDMRRLLEELPGKICSQISKELQKLSHQQDRSHHDNDENMKPSAP